MYSIILKGRNDNTDYYDLLANKKIHVVCFATGGLTFSHEYIKKVVPDERQAFTFYNEVGTKKETGTLYPLAYLTMIPIEYIIYPYDGYQAHPTAYTRDDYKKFINDALIAEFEYIKCGKMFFDLLDITICKLGNNTPWFYIEIIKELLENEYTDKHLEFIIRF